MFTVADGPEDVKTAKLFLTSCRQFCKQLSAKDLNIIININSCEQTGWCARSSEKLQLCNVSIQDIGGYKPSAGKQNEP
jgi:hypothetical protein